MSKEEPQESSPEERKSILSHNKLIPLAGHIEAINSVAWSPDGRLLASASADNTIRLWDTHTNLLLHILEGHTRAVRSVTWSPDGRLLASASADKTICLWDVSSGPLLHILEGHSGWVNSVAWSPDGRLLASASADDTIRLWETSSGSLLRTTEVYSGWVNSVAWSSDSRLLASASADTTVHLWDASSGSLLHTLEGHTSEVHSVAWSPDGQILVSQDDNTLRIWRPGLWETVDIVEGITTKYIWNSLHFFAHAPLLATLDKSNTAVHIWNVDIDAFLPTWPSVSSVHYTTAKIALVGDSSVGKTGLSYRIAEHHFQVTESTHGQQFWVVDELGKTRADGTLCEAILWDFAGQPNFRPIHALFLENVDLALILFDPARPDTLAGVDY